MNPEKIAATLEELSPIIVNRHRRSLRSVVQRFNEEDLLQATYIKAHQGCSKFRGQTEAELRAWILTIASSVCNTALTTHAKSQKRSTDAEQSLVPGCDGDKDSLESEASLKQEIKDQCTRMLQCLDRLPKQRQHVLRMKYLEGKAYSEIANSLGVTADAARSSVAQALRAVRLEMDQPSLPGF